MDLRLICTLLAALVWGFAWASFLQWCPLGQWLAVRRTWLSVTVGIGVDLLLARIVLDWDVWVVVVSIVALSSVGMITRSHVNEWGVARITMAQVDQGGEGDGGTETSGE